jgi:transcriptional regulator with XRE-family HTH domain
MNSINIGAEIKSIRKKLGLTQEQFCVMINKKAPQHVKIERSVLSKYENGVIMPPAIMYAKIKKAGKNI